MAEQVRQNLAAMHMGEASGPGAPADTSAAMPLRMTPATVGLGDASSASYPPTTEA